MPDYSDLNGAFEAQLERTARFVPAAFHVHSIDSYDWGKEADKTRNDKAQFEGDGGVVRFLNELASAGLGLVCITDHMKSAYACSLAQHAKGREDIVVLPGMEISCSVPPGHSEYIHVLAVFHPDTSPDVIERIFDPGFSGERDRTGKEVARFESLTDVRQRVDQAGGLFIVAHIGSDRGHRAYVRSERGKSAEMLAIDPDAEESIRAISNEYAEHLVGLDPHAVEVSNSAERQHYFRFHTTDGREHEYACVARSDHHSVEALRSPEAITYVKVSRRDLSCIRAALAFHETRIRFSDDLPEIPSPRLIGVRLTGPGGGLFTDALIGLNENLNCIIGPRGAGKSTIIEALRYVLGQRPLLEGGTSTGTDDRSYASLAMRTQDANLIDTQIEVIYESGGQRHVLSATFEPGASATTKVYSLDGTDCHIPPDTLEADYPARIFSWSELETLGRQPQLQRLVVDRLAQGLADLQERLLELRGKLAENRRWISDLREELERLLAVEGDALRRYTANKTQFDRLNTEEVRGLFAELDDTRARIAIIEKVDAQLEAVVTALDDIEGRGAREAIEAIVAAAPQALQEWWGTHVATALDIAALEQAVDSQVAALRSEVGRRRGVLGDVLERERDIEEQREAALRERTNADPQTSIRGEHREEARRRFERSEELRKQYLEVLATLEGALADRAAVLDELRTVSADITAARQTTADDLATRLADVGQSGPEITITVDAGADRGALIRYLDERFLNPDRGGHYRAKELPRRLGAVEPVALARAIEVNRPDDLVSPGDDGVTIEEAQKLVDSTTPFSDDESAGVKLVEPELLELLELQEQPVEDLVRINSDGRPVDELSPGGRSSAMLPLIALSDNAPLIIDQPEDNLDNRMVGQTLSSILARLKEKRQIIVTTHNPNIVVGGDAEQVVVLDAPTARSARVEVTGSIDDDQIIDAVIKIMEGGREAFEERSRRYERRLAP